MEIYQDSAIQIDQANERYVVTDYDSYCPDFTWKFQTISSSANKSTKTGTIL